MSVKLLTEHHLEFLSLKRGCTDSSKSTHVKIPHCWKSHALAHIDLVTVTPYAIEYINSSLRLSKARIFYRLIYKPSYCNFLESRNKIKSNF